MIKATTVQKETLRHIPKVDRVLSWDLMAPLAASHQRPELLAAIRSVLDRLRAAVRNGDPVDFSEERVVSLVRAELDQRSMPSLREVVNASGVVIHTNLGRSPLATAAEEAIHRASRGYSNLEFDLAAGERGTRYVHVEGLICELTGAEAALVVNNNAAAVILALSSLAQGRDVIVSRGELVEIGGSFRIPEVMLQSGARLVEVGATNRTHPRDYRAAINDATALLLKVHTSNFAVVGFTAEVTAEEMSALGRETGVPVMVDAGSGCLIDLAPYGIAGESTIRRYLAAGADVVTFSGDKLLGGPQAGIIAGRRDLVEPMKRHPLLRALRMDKLSLAALEATLRLYRDERRAIREIPTLAMLTATPADLSRRADRILGMLRRRLPKTVTLAKQPGESSAGGGSLPLLRLPTSLIEVRIAGASVQQIEQGLRLASIPVVGRIQRDRFLLDVRTILDHDLPGLALALGEAAASLSGGDQ
ncbi:L-seryl-tRNA(Sec) selenium transferase [Oryzomonas sagensis]|uniref:L-seryl-tRNA(Sec) selenium transferase n=1 Tax=Oryzomonas sagensis TaxID=2603857 RepID=A0ABQ6TR26_9BACT|nr:L-seryl-tRNA(Sec) selenium transferase [Oryzomonas sagensis]KAB0671172.1 L-seryl-tRNA(Sec) selenium transferase [Oryzomonas sagensis]